MTDIAIEQRGSVLGWSKLLIPALREAIEGGVLEASEIAAGEVRRAISGAFRSGRGGLARSYRATLLTPKARNEVRGGAVSDLIYAHIQDEGGTITARNARALAIPLTHQARRTSEKGVGPRGFGARLALVWPKGRNRGFLVESRGRESIFHYLLKRAVRIPGTGYLDRARDAAEPQIKDVLDASIQKGTEEVPAGGE